MILRLIEEFSLKWNFHMFMQSMAKCPVCCIQLQNVQNKQQFLSVINFDWTLLLKMKFHSMINMPIGLNWPLFEPKEYEWKKRKIYSIYGTMLSWMNDFPYKISSLAYIWWNVITDFVWCSEWRLQSNLRFWWMVLEKSFWS